jgi:hypothetical protein
MFECYACHPLAHLLLVVRRLTSRIFYYVVVDPTSSLLNTTLLSVGSGGPSQSEPTRRGALYKPLKHYGWFKSRRASSVQV